VPRGKRAFRCSFGELGDFYFDQHFLFVLTNQFFFIA
jgi:hypothetical protein